MSLHFPSSPLGIGCDAPDPQALEFARIMRVKTLDKSSDKADRKERVELRAAIVEARRTWLTQVLSRFLNDNGLGHLRASHWEDLRQEGVIALLEAIDRFDPDFGTLFSTYAEERVIGAFRHYVRDKVGLIRESRTSQERRAQTGEAAPVRVEQPFSDDALDVHNGESDFTGNVELKDAVTRAFQAWDNENEIAIRSRRAIYATFFEGARLADLAAEFGVSTTQAHRYLRAGQERMRAFLTEQGIQ